MKIKTIYIEDKVKNHHNTKKIVSRIKYEHIIICDHYSEVFNPKNQNFRIQKKFPALILARKENNFIHTAPEQFSIGFKNNYYFSHMLNCPYDCKYCYLQGMLNSANYLLFVNYEDFLVDIKAITESNIDQSCFFSGYDCDSLALEGISNFIEEFIRHFEKIKKGVLEIRSKSINIKVLEKKKPLKNIIPAFSLNPEFVIKSFEDKTPNLLNRIIAIKKLQTLGWSVGLRFDPLISCDRYEKYKKFFYKIFKSIDVKKVHSVTLGEFRMPNQYLKKISNVRTNDYFIQLENTKRFFNRMDGNQKEERRESFTKLISKFISKEKIFLN